MSRYFEGLYFKHQQARHAVAFIAGKADDHSFIQLISNNRSHCFFYPLSAYHSIKTSDDYETIIIDGNEFSAHGIKLNIKRDGIEISGDISYNNLTPPRYDIMGPFKYLPMQCRHKVVSLHHDLHGGIYLDGEMLDFSGGTGYMEGDAGNSFPGNYTWFQCNDFAPKACVMAAVADIPLAMLRFRGCIACVYWGGTEYRLATYLGAKIMRCDENSMIIRQGGLCLEIAPEPGSGKPLWAPRDGCMTREITERAACSAYMRFTMHGQELFAHSSDLASFEHVE